MRLPDIPYSVSQPVPVYPEKDTDLSQVSRLARGIAETVVDVKKQNDKLKVAQATAALKNANASLSETLQGMDAIDIDSPDFGKSASESLRIGAGVVNDTDVYTVGNRRFVPTEKVMDTVYSTALREQFDMITDGMGEDLKGQVWAGFSESQAGTMRDLAKHKRELTQGKMSAGFQQVFTQYMQQGDIAGAMKAADDALATGAWSPKEYNKAKEDGMKDYYANSALVDISNANSDEELDEIERRVKGNIDLFGASQARQFLNDIDERRNDFKQYVEDNRKATATHLVLSYSRGELDQATLDDAALNGAIEPTAYLSWTERLKTDAEKSANKPLVRSDRQTVDNLTAEMQAIKYASGTETTVTERAREFQARVMRLSSGIDPTNPNAPGSPRALNPEDAQKLIEESEKVAKSVLRPQNFDVAKSIIQSYTGTSDFGTLGNVGQKKAYQAFYGELIDYIEQSGAEADVLVWVEQNKARFNPEIMDAEIEDRFLSIYPQYQSHTVETETTTATGKPTKAKRLNVQAVKSSIFKEYMDGSISKAERDARYYDLIGEEGSRTPLEKRRLAEDQELFYKSLKEFGGASGY